MPPFSRHPREIRVCWTPLDHHVAAKRLILARRWLPKDQPQHAYDRKHRHDHSPFHNILLETQVIGVGLPTWRRALTLRQ